MYVPLLLCLKIFAFYNDLPYLLRLYFVFYRTMCLKAVALICTLVIYNYFCKMSQVLHSVFLVLEIKNC